MPQQLVGLVQLAPGLGPHDLLGRTLAALFAHDFQYTLETVEFGANQVPSVSLQTRDITEGRTKFAIKRTAAVMARALAIPCLARFDKDLKEPPPWLVEKPPQLGQCAILKAYVDYDKLL